MKRQIIEGVIQGNERGYAFLIPHDPKMEDFFIPHGDLKGALHKDVVLAEATYGKGERTTARVLKIINRGLDEIVGTYFSSKSGGFVIADDKKFSIDVFVPFGRGVRVKSGDKVVCKIIAYPHRKKPEGLIKEVLGRQFTKDAELNSILKSYSVEIDFPKTVTKFASSVTPPTEQDIIGRKDFRSTTTFTIDGDDSRDFDDAVSITKNEKGNYELGVHIADVSHYVRSGNPIDVEALNRGTSVYFPENVAPMLPEKLCNDVCSLVQGADRLTLSCVIKIDKNGFVVDSEIYKSVINSKARTTYSKVQKVLDGDEEQTKEYSHIYNDLFLMNELCDLLIKRREEKGSIDLDVKESSISVDDKGRINVCAFPRDKAHRIIEEFMILANVCVAEKMTKLNIPCLYRVHEKPAEEKYRQFLTFLRGVGVNFSYIDNLTTKHYQGMLDSLKDHPAFSVINRVMLRSMKKAKYHKEPLGHFGLGEELYCHFTSPIRRYPDLFVHRVLKDYMEKGKDFVCKKYQSIAPFVAEKSSNAERNAIEAERAVDDYYKTLYISNYVGEEFDGVVSGVTPFGIFVELENGVEGLVKIQTLNGRKYDYDENNFLLSNGVNKYRLGQSVRICVAGVDLGERRAEFLIIK